MSTTDVEAYEVPAKTDTPPLPRGKGRCMAATRHTWEAWHAGEPSAWDRWDPIDRIHAEMLLEQIDCMHRATVHGDTRAARRHLALIVLLERDLGLMGPPS